MASDEALVQAARILSRTLGQKVPLQDLEFSSDPKTDALYQRCLNSYADELLNASPADQRLWILRRLASIESRLMLLQANQATEQAKTLDRSLEPEDVFTISRSQKTFPALLSLLVDDSIVETGFYRTETHASGLKFRWIGPEPRASIFLPRVDAPVQITLSVMHTYPDGILDKVKVALDEGPWSSGKVVKEGDRALLHFAPTPGAKRFLQTMQLDIDAVRTLSPKQDGKGDSRSLSIALWKIEAHPLA